MLLLISNNPIFDRWLDAAALRATPRSNKLSPTKTAADWFNLPEPEQHLTHTDDRCISPRAETQE